MLKEFEFFHGVVFARILHGGNTPISIKGYPTSDNASYVVNDNAGIYIKYSSKRMSPWRFSFQKEHQDEILDMKNKFGEVYTVLEGTFFFGVRRGSARRWRGDSFVQFPLEKGSRKVYNYSTTIKLSGFCPIDLARALNFPLTCDQYVPLSWQEK